MTEKMIFQVYDFVGARKMTKPISAQGQGSPDKPGERGGGGGRGGELYVGSCPDWHLGDDGM